MEKLTSILVVVDRTDETHPVLVKAIALARRFGAKLELLLCDSERAYALRQTYDRSGVARARQTILSEGRRFLESLQQSVAADDVSISVHVVCESPLSEGVVRRVRESWPDLVLKSAASRHAIGRLTLDANDWELARTCPVPIMLTRGRPWRVQPRFAAAVDVSEQETVGLARAILHAGENLSFGFGAELEVLYSERGNGKVEGREKRTAALRRLAHEFQVGADRVHVLPGEPEHTLPSFAADRRFDVLILGALTHRKGLVPLIGTLTGKLVVGLECDLVFIKPACRSLEVEPDQAALA
jgi:universal stress protein E